jgi:hypothetical protein
MWQVCTNLISQSFFLSSSSSWKRKLNQKWSPNLQLSKLFIELQYLLEQIYIINTGQGFLTGSADCRWKIYDLWQYSYHTVSQWLSALISNANIFFKKYCLPVVPGGSFQSRLWLAPRTVSPSLSSGHVYNVRIYEKEYGGRHCKASEPENKEYDFKTLLTGTYLILII